MGVIRRTDGRDMRYQHIEKALAQLHLIGNDNIKAFRARIRHLREQGIPALPRTGSGIQIAYTEDHLHQLFLALELEAFDIDPVAAADFVKQRWPEINGDLAVAKNAGEDQYLAFEPFYLGETFGGSGVTIGFGIVNKKQLVQRYFGDSLSHHHGRLAVIFLSRRLRALYEFLDEHRK